MKMNGSVLFLKIFELYDKECEIGPIESLAAEGIVDEDENLSFDETFCGVI